MKEIIDEIREKFDKKIGHLLADRGTEFMGEFRELLKRNKIPNSKTIAGQSGGNL